MVKDAAEKILTAIEGSLVGRRAELEAMLAAFFADGHVLLEGPPGTGKTLAVRVLAAVSGCSLQAHPVHAGPHARRRRRHARLRSARGQLPAGARAGLRRRRARRRDQPRAGQDPGGAARGDGGAPRDHRRRFARIAPAVHGLRHHEPHRVRGHLPAARGAARSLPHEGPHGGHRRRRRARGDRALRRRFRSLGDRRAAGAGGARRSQACWRFGRRCARCAWRTAVQGYLVDLGAPHPQPPGRRPGRQHPLRGGAAPGVAGARRLPGARLRHSRRPEVPRPLRPLAPPEPRARRRSSRASTATGSIAKILQEAPVPRLAAA